MSNLKIKARLLVTLAVFSSIQVADAQSTGFNPAAILKMDSFFAHHVIVAEKSTHTLHLYENKDSRPKLVKSYPMATGKVAGDKKIEGDFKTPEGIYYFTQFMNNRQLVKQSGPMAAMYGAGAFVMNYPNAIDRLNKKTGSGIWLHSTNDETRIDKGLDSRGCVVTANNELIEVSKFIELNKTPIVVVQELNYLNDKTHELYRTKLDGTISSWLEAWRNKDIEKYISFYHPELFKDKNKNYHQFKNYKKLIFSNPGKPSIELDHLSILVTDEYAVATFTQKYNFLSVNDTGKKILYLMKDDNYNWKIVSENFTKNGLENLEQETRFSPSLRFFNAATKEGIELTFEGNTLSE